MQVVRKDSGITTNKVEAVSQERPSIIQLQIAPEKVIRFERQGDDLALMLRDGSKVLVPNFFLQYPDGGRNDLLLEDDAGVQWWGQYTSPWSEFHFTEIEWLDGAPVLPPEGFPAWLLAGLALLGVAAASSGGGGGGGGDAPPALNQPPIGDSAPLALRAGEVGRGRVLGRDADGDAVNYTLTKQPAHGSITLDPLTGEYTYTPNSGYRGSDVFEVTVNDGKGGTAVVSVPVSVEPPDNQIPTADAPSLSTPEGQPVGGKIIAEDADGDPLAFVLGEGPSHGTVTLDPGTGEYIYTPNPDYAGTDTFTVVVSDGKGGSTTSTVNITVTSGNDAPTVPDYTLSTPEDTPLQGQVGASDTDSDGLTYIVGKPPANGTLTLNPDGTYSYTPGADFHGTDIFTVLVSDGKGGTATSTVNITVTPVNDAPTAPNYTLRTPEDTPVTGKVVSSDVDGDVLTYVVGKPPANGTVVVNTDGTYSYSPGANFNGSDTFTVVVSDGNGGTTTSTVNVTVTPVNHAPTVPDYTLTTAEDTSVAGKVVSSDIDGDMLSYVLGTPPTNGTVALNPDGSYSYTPGSDFNGLDSFTVVISDGNGGTAVSTVSVTVTPVNDLPTAPNYTVETPEDTAVTGQVVGSDVDGDVLTYVMGETPVNGTVVLNPDGTYSYTPGLHFNGSDSFTVVVSDGSGGSITSTVNVKVTPVNDIPTVPDYTLTTAEDTPVTGQVVGDDVEGDDLTYTVGELPTNGTVVLNPDGTYTYTPDGDFAGSDSFTVVVSDGNGGTSTSTVNVTVTPVNDIPTAPNYTLNTPEDTPVTGQVVGSDVDGDDLTYVVGQVPANGTVVVNADGTYSYIPGANFNGSDTFTVLVSDGKGGTATSTVNITVTAVNDAPVFVDPVNGTPIVNYDFVYNENSSETSVLGRVQATDVDSGVPTYSIVAGNDNGWFEINASGQITLTAAGAAAQANDFEAGPNVHALTVRASDGSGGVTEVAVNLTEQNVNEAPTLSVISGNPVYEEGLANGIHTGPAPATVSTGTFSIADGDAGTGASNLTVSLTGPVGVTSDGQPVVWTWNAATSTLTGTATLEGVSTAIMSVQVGAVSQVSPGNFTASYTATLTGPVDHGGLGEDTLSLNFAATVSDGSASSQTANFVVDIQDDVPVLGDGSISVNVVPLQTNLMVVLDLSGSMANETPTRLQRAKEAIENLIQAYDDYGDVKVKLVTFSSEGEAIDGWLDPAAAISTINAFASGGGTNYWGALEAAMGSSGYTDAGKLAGPQVQNISYFFTDGEPTGGQDVNAARESQWVDFVRANEINSYSIGIGNSLNSSHQARVDPIAYDGSEGATGTNTNGLIISDTSELDEILQGTVGAPATGNLLTGGLGQGQGFGADGGYVSSLTVDGDVYMYDTKTGLMTVTPDAGLPNYSFSEVDKAVTIITQAGGTLIVDFEAGEFTYNAKPQAYTETLTYQVTDRDGDVSNVGTQTLNVTFDANPTPFARMASPEMDMDHNDETSSALVEDFGVQEFALTDLVSESSKNESSLEDWLNSAFAPANADADSAPDIAWTDAVVQLDTAAYVPPHVSALDEDLHTASTAYA